MTHDPLHDFLADAPNWACSECGEQCNPVDSAWRMTGSAWEHRCAHLIPQAGYREARRFGPPLPPTRPADPARDADVEAVLHSLNTCRCDDAACRNEARFHLARIERRLAVLAEIARIFATTPADAECAGDEFLSVLMPRAAWNEVCAAMNDARLRAALEGATDAAG